MLHQLLKNSNRLTLMTSFELEHGDDTLRALPFVPILPAPSIWLLMRENWLPTRLHANFIEIVRAQVARTTPKLRQVG